MTEHDAPTVARAMIWLDTSSDTPTRPGGCLDDYTDEHTTRVRRIDTAKIQAQAPLQTLAFTAQGFGAQGFGAQGFGATETFERAEVPRPRWLRLAKQSRSPRTMTCVFVAALVAAAFALGQRTARSAATVALATRAVAASPAVQASSVAPEPVAPQTKVGPALQAPPSSDVLANASEKDAVEALARGDYPRALKLYRALAVEHPHEAAFKAIEQLLSARVVWAKKTQCASGERKDGLCAG